MYHKVVLLFGGDSDERLVSVASAQAMAEAIHVDKLWFWHKDGQVFEINYNFLNQHKDPFTSELIPNSAPIFTTIKDAINSSVVDDHVFLLGVHGGSGENGELQNLLEKAGRPYTGSNSVASKRAFDKVATKACLVDHNITMAPQIIIEARDKEIAPKLEAFFSSHGSTVVKPVCGGSSIGCFFIKTKEDIITASDAIANLPAQAFLAEKMIFGRELSVGVIESKDGLIGLSGTEIVLDRQRDFDYEGKYLGRGSQEITPPKMPQDLIIAAQELAQKAHRALALDAYSRTDMILANDGFYYLETNTLPGMTKQSLVPQQLRAAGISIEDFLRDLIERAIVRAKF